MLLLLLFAERIFPAIRVQLRHITHWHHRQCWTRRNSSISSTPILSSSFSITWRYVIFPCIDSKCKKKLSWCWQTRAVHLEVSQGHQTW